MLLWLLHRDPNPNEAQQGRIPWSQRSPPTYPSCMAKGKETWIDVRWHERGFPALHPSPATGLGYWYQFGLEWSLCLLWASYIQHIHFLGWFRLFCPKKAITCVWLALVLINPSCLLHMTSYLSQMSPYLSGYSFPSMLLNSFPKHFPDLYFLGMTVLGIGRKRNSLLWLQMYWLIQN